MASTIAEERQVFLAMLLADDPLVSEVVQRGVVIELRFEGPTWRPVQLVCSSFEAACTVLGRLAWWRLGAGRSFRITPIDDYVEKRA